MSKINKARWFDKLEELGAASIPYLHQGNSRSGADCVGLMLLTLSELGLDYREFDVPDRSYNPPARALVRQLTRAFGPQVSGWGNCRVVVFRSWSAGPQHLALCGVDRVGGEWLLHAHRDSGRVEFLRWNAKAGPQIYGFWEIP
jgi:hypothetical protein